MNTDVDLHSPSLHGHAGQCSQHFSELHIQCSRLVCTFRWGCMASSASSPCIALINSGNVETLCSWLHACILVRCLYLLCMVMQLHVHTSREVDLHSINLARSTSNALGLHSFSGKHMPVDCIHSGKVHILYNRYAHTVHAWCGNNCCIHIHILCCGIALMHLTVVHTNLNRVCISLLHWMCQDKCN